MGGGKSPKAPPPRDYYKESTDALKAQIEYAPSLYAAEAAFRPQYQRLELGGYQNALLGRIREGDLSEASRGEYRQALARQQQAAESIPALERQLAAARAGTRVGSTGLGGGMTGGLFSGKKAYTKVDKNLVSKLEVELNQARAFANATPEASSFSDRGLLEIMEQDIMPSMARAEAGVNAFQRESDISDVERLGRRASDAYLNADPRTKALLERLNQQVNADLANNGRLSADEQRLVEQQARAGFAARGLALGRQSVASELFNTQKQIDARKTFARDNARTVLGLNKQFTADPFMAILGRQGQAFAAGNQQQSFGQNFASSIGPRLFNPESQAAFDINASNQQAIMATNAAKASITAGMYQGIGSAIGGGAQGLGTYGACWVAREVYGVDNFKWEIFRDWMLHDSPEWFKDAYLTYGEKFAEVVKNNKFIKMLVKSFMDLTIAKHTSNG